MRKLALSLAVIGAALATLNAWIWWPSNPKQRLGEEIVRKIESFRVAQTRLPESLDEIGIEVKSLSDPPVYYRKESPDRYIVWYGLSLGESMTYDSATRKWEEHH